MPPESRPGTVEQYLAGMRAELALLLSIAERLAAADNDRAALAALQRETHKIQGPANSYGFLEASRLAAGMEATVKDWASRPDAGEVDRGDLTLWFVTRLAAMLKLEMPRRAAAPLASATAPAPPPATSPPRPPPPRLILRRPSAAHAAPEPPPPPPPPPPAAGPKRLRDLVAVDPPTAPVATPQPQPPSPPPSPPPPEPPADVRAQELTWLVAPDEGFADRAPEPRSDAARPLTPETQLSLGFPPPAAEPPARPEPTAALPTPEPEPIGAPPSVEPPAPEPPQAAVPPAPVPEPVEVGASVEPPAPEPPLAAAPPAPEPELVEAAASAEPLPPEPPAAPPLAPEPQPATTEAATTVVEVIYVEDDPALAELLEYGLRARGYRFLSYRNGREALRELLALDVHGTHPLLLLDVDLPALDGYSILDALQRERPGTYRVVFTTVHGTEEEQLRGLEAGALDYLLKPISLRVALEKIKRWVGR